LLYPFITDSLLSPIDSSMAKESLLEPCWFGYLGIASLASLAALLNLTLLLSCNDYARLFSNITAVSWQQSTRSVPRFARFPCSLFPTSHPSTSINTPDTSPSPRAGHSPSTIHPHLTSPRGKRARAYARARAHDLTLTEQLPTLPHLTSTRPNPTSHHLSPS
jgi:hypothetical protein